MGAGVISSWRSFLLQEFTWIRKLNTTMEVLSWTCPWIPRGHTINSKNVQTAPRILFIILSFPRQ